MTDSVLEVERDEGVVTLTLNRPAAMNALSQELRAGLASAFAKLEADPDARVVILTGAGERAFSAGLDLKELGGEPGARASERRPASSLDVVAAIESFTGPVIGAINGYAITGGFELALACDILIGSPAARFADTHARVGIMPGWGLSQKLSRLVGIYRAKELSLTGNFLTAQDAVAWGLLNRVVPADELLPTCRELARDMLSCDPELLVAYKRVIDEGFAETFAEGRRIETRANRERDVTPEKIAARRQAIQERGRAQG